MFIKLLLGFVLLFTTTQSTPSFKKDVAPVAKVYACDSKTSVAYHSRKDCGGLRCCRHTIIEVTGAEVQKNYGKRKCKVCY
ncbi:MAG: hypothetical protein J7502_02960 [Flavisolibacter sp.]|nr:hypothetical protein [Flavisolibacter sp.]